ncbi:MAG: hypothetical protein IPJ98_02570 [Bryobacterales bacterium]|nr:hypothetical protein [Bryobacterales bacterium]
MNLTERDRRALLLLAGCAALFLVIYLWPQNDGTAEVVAPDATSIPAAERRLIRLRDLAATVPARQKVLDEARKELALREKGLYKSPTAPQNAAEILQHIRKLARAQSPAIDIQQTDLGPVEPLGKEYGESVVTVNFNCRIVQLLNLLADISAQPELIATRDLNIRAGDPKQKTMAVRLTVGGVVNRSLVPKRKEIGSL